MGEPVTGGTRSMSLTGRPKRLFVQMALAAAVLVVVTGSALLYALVRHATEVRAGMVLLLELGIVLFILVVGVTLTAIAWLTWTDRGVSPPFRRAVQSVLLLILPLAVFAGRILGRSRDDVQASFIAVTNALTGKAAVNIDPSQILVLIPRCMQLAECIHKVSQDVNRCRRCGRCPLAKILEATDGIDLPVHVSTGGTQARRIVKETRPEVIVAVACERELTEGIRDVGGFAVIGVVNQRPHGPCHNTDVDVEKLTATLKRIMAEPEEVDHVLL